jgi:hypothetical protein
MRMLRFSFVSFFVLISFLFFLYLFSEEKINTTYSKKSSVLLEYAIGGDKFVIPRNYIWDETAVANLSIQHVNMQTIYPSMEPYTERTKEIFYEAGWSKGEVSFYIATTNVNNTGQKNIDFITSANNYNFVKSSYAFDVYSISYDSSHQIFMARENDEIVRAFRCGKEEYLPYPSCSTRINYMPSVVLKYSFSKKLLNEWQEIEIEIFTLINGFKATVSTNTKE